ncbi:hypothetical protein EYF80_043566 [Liparis tanakae]|uniref:Uncharacterized protein n=1 Tax=Liparis tanakae TaxID=230148 RepID=A0A4Z2FY52_9TELE|nr:hypothetical protein EYF80_043566 [Liparis tanakae]
MKPVRYRGAVTWTYPLYLWLLDEKSLHQRRPLKEKKSYSWSTEIMEVINGERALSRNVKHTDDRPDVLK